ncbi:MAG TPA: hypothetical protein DEB06_05845 [Phycisphaerales bacterium]|nr:hypothetical protein [Phycisphaerales bacterium]
MGGTVGAPAQVPPDPGPDPAPAPVTPAPTNGSTPPPVLLGARVEGVRRAIKVVPTVVLVRNAADFARIVGGWTLRQRFPVLIDDGTDGAREDIARFVRAFEPRTVIRWSPPDNAPPLPDDPEGRRSTLDEVARLSWGARTPEELAQVWAQTQFRPFGVVVASPRDPAWTAAVALAAGRGQPIVWTDTGPRPPGDVFDEAGLQSLLTTIEAGVEALNPGAGGEGGWRGLGDGIDSVTLCLNAPSRITVAGDRLALTDRVGRFADDSRWAWCGMIFGDERTAAYRAMCALFLTPRSALLFDGYKRSFAPPYDLQPGADLLTKAGWKVELSAEPRGGLDDWRARGRFGFTADYIHVNSSGLPSWFDLTPGRARPSDVPALNRPAIVHFIHSFSAERIDDPNTVGGRWLANGAYAYFGSVSEPYLAAFLPGPLVTARMLALAPWGAAVRQDQGKLWKVNVFGDPLIVAGAPQPRVEEPLDGSAGASVEDEMRAALGAGRLVEAASALVILGRDEDAVRLAQAAIKQNGSCPPDLARVVIHSAARRRDAPLLIELYASLSRADRLVPEFADLFWQVARAELEDSKDARLGALMRDAVRERTLVEDAAALAPFLLRTSGAGAARAFVGEMIDRAPTPEARAALVEESRKY